MEIENGMPRTVAAAYVNTANSSKESNCEFHDCGGVPGLVATRKIEPGDGISEDYGNIQNEPKRLYR